MVHVHVHGACACPWCMCMSMVHVHVHGACACPCFMSMLNIYVSVHVHAAHHRCVCVFEFVCINAGMPDCPACDQSSTGLKKTNDARTGSVPDQTKAVQLFFGPVPD